MESNLQGVQTKPLNMFQLHELYIDGQAVAYIREVGEKVQVITFAKFTNSAPDSRYVNPEGLNKMIAGFRTMLAPKGWEQADA